MEVQLPPAHEAGTPGRRMPGAPCPHAGADLALSHGEGQFYRGRAAVRRDLLRECQFSRPGGGR